VIPRTRFVISSITFAVAAGMVGASAEDKAFRPGRASDYAHQTSQQVTIGAKSYDTEELTAEAFGKKTDLLRYGVLPVLVVIENKRQKPLDLRDIEVNLVAADGRHAGPVRPEDIPFMGKRTKVPTMNPVPNPLPRKKNPLNAPQIVERAFAAKMLPPGDSTSGFFYFEAKPEPGDKLYLNGLRDTPSGQDILYFEFGLDR
jgi:hypothetical protein